MMINGITHMNVKCYKNKTRKMIRTTCMHIGEIKFTYWYPKNYYKLVRVAELLLNGKIAEPE